LNLTWQNQISRRNGMRLLACGLVFLGVCVFAWGLRYKLSLYDPPQSVSHRIPAAKLLSGKEQVAVQALNRARAASPAVPAVLLGLGLIFAFLRSMRVQPRFMLNSAWLAPGVPAPSRVAASYCFTRPPPPSR
jgi:hypothetical protein